MPTRDRPIDRAVRRSGRLRQVAGDELRNARIGLGLSQRFVANASGISQTQVSRIERAALSSVTIDALCRMATVVGLDVSIKFYPGDRPFRDQAQIRLLDRFRLEVGPPLILKAEVPIPIPGDQRAWDLCIVGLPEIYGVEAETRLWDLQAVQRKLTLKARDSNIGRVILLVSATHANRTALDLAAASLEEMFPVGGRAALRALRAGQDPGGSAIILL
jgi:transcriptional regulator with XRE-family HTH domain